MQYNIESVYIFYSKPVYYYVSYTPFLYLLKNFIESVNISFLGKPSPLCFIYKLIKVTVFFNRTSIKFFNSEF